MRSRAVVRHAPIGVLLGLLTFCAHTVMQPSVLEPGAGKTGEAGGIPHSRAGLASCIHAAWGSNSSHRLWFKPDDGHGTADGGMETPERIEGRCTPPDAVMHLALNIDR